MRAAVIRGLGEGFLVEDLRIAEPIGREVLVEVRASGLCHSDLHFATIDFGVPLPAVLGHELAGVVLAVVALFGFMFVNTGPDADKQAQLRAQERAAEETSATYVPPTVTTTEPEASTTEVDDTEPARDEKSPRNLALYCAGARGIGAFEYRLMAASVEQDVEEMRSTIDEGAADWEDAVADLQAGAPPRFDDVIASYQQTYRQMFEAVRGAGDLDSLRRALDGLGLEELNQDASVMNLDSTARCS